MSSSQTPFGRRVFIFIKKKNFDLKLDSTEKDILISQLKAQIFEYEQHEKDYDSLNHKFRILQNEY